MTETNMLIKPLLLCFCLLRLLAAPIKGHHCETSLIPIFGECQVPFLTQVSAFTLLEISTIRNWIVLCSACICCCSPLVISSFTRFLLGHKTGVVKCVDLQIPHGSSRLMLSRSSPFVFCCYLAWRYNEVESRPHRFAVQLTQLSNGVTEILTEIL